MAAIKEHTQKKEDIEAQEREKVQRLVIEWYPEKGGLAVNCTEGLPAALGLVKLASDFYDNVLKAGAQQAMRSSIQIPGRQM